MVVNAFIRVGHNPLAIFLRDDYLTLLKRFLVVLLWYNLYKHFDFRGGKSTLYFLPFCSLFIIMQHIRVRSPTIPYSLLPIT